MTEPVSNRRYAMRKTGIGRIGALRPGRIKRRIERIVQKSLQRPIVVDRDPAGHLPGAFIIAAPRSGVSLLRLIFDRHPEIAAPPETLIFPHLLGALREERVMRAMWNAGFHREFLARSLGDFGRSFIEDYVTTRRKRFWIDITVRHVEWLPELREACPDVKFLMLYRHPFDIVRSMMERAMMEQPRFAGWLRDHPSSFAACCAYVARQHRAMLAFEARHRKFAHSIRYERFVVDPERELAAACAFLGVGATSDMLDFASADRGSGIDAETPARSSAIIPRVRTFSGWSEGDQIEARTYLQEDLDLLGYPP